MIPNEKDVGIGRGPVTPQIYSVDNKLFIHNVMELYDYISEWSNIL